MLWAFSIAVVVAVIWLTVVFGLGVRTVYGPGVSSSFGDQVVRDFLADQNAEAAALSNRDESQVNSRLSDAALSDVLQQIHGQSAQATVSLQPSSITVLRAQDPNDPTLTIEVQEDGTKSVTSSPGADSAPTQSQVGFHGTFWLRVNGGRYTIADQSIQNKPSTYLPQIALAMVGVIWVGLASVLFRRMQMKTTVQPVASRPLHAIDAAGPPEAEAPAPSARTVIRLYGGLQVLEGGKDWATALNGRPMMSFVWRRVLLAAIEGRAVSREEMGRQASPGFEREDQLRKIRNLLYTLRALAEPLRTRFIAEPQVLKFDLDDCWVDAIELSRLSSELGHQQTLVPAQLARAKSIIKQTRGVLMPEFDSLDDVLTSHRSSAGEELRALRQELGGKRASLAGLVADTYLVARQTQNAIELLELVLRDQPEQSDLAARLAFAQRAASAPPASE